MDGKGCLVPVNVAVILYLLVGALTTIPLPGNERASWLSFSIVAACLCVPVGTLLALGWPVDPGLSGRARQAIAVVNGAAALLAIAWGFVEAGSGGPLSPLAIVVSLVFAVIAFLNMAALGGPIRR